MAKQQQVAKIEESNLVPMTEGGFLDKYRAEDAGKGISTSAADKQVPLLRVLQALSPQVKTTNPLYIDGATEGMILMRGAPQELIRGENGFIFQPCYLTKHIVEWIPREQGGGYAGRHAFMPGDLEDIANAGRRLGARPDSKNKFKYVLPNNHELIETRYQVGNIIFDADTILPYVIPFSGSGHSVSKQWTYQLDTMRSKLASFGTVWELKTRWVRNAQGDWYVLNPRLLGPIDVAPLPAGFTMERREALYLAGKALYESMATGAREIGEEEGGSGVEDLGDSGAQAGV